MIPPVVISTSSDLAMVTHNATAPWFQCHTKGSLGKKEHTVFFSTVRGEVMDFLGEHLKAPHSS